MTTHSQDGSMPSPTGIPISCDDHPDTPAPTAPTPPGMDDLNQIIALSQAIDTHMDRAALQQFLAQNPTYIADCCAWYDKSKNPGIVLALNVLKSANLLDPATRKWLETHQDLMHTSDPRERSRKIRDLPVMSPIAGKQAVRSLRRTVESVLDDKSEVQWIVDGMLPTGVITLLSASPKAGKTTLLLSLMSHMDKGTPWAGMNVVKEPAWLYTEEGNATLREGMEKVGVTRHSKHSIIPVSGKEMDWPTFCEHVAADAQELHEAWNSSDSDRTMLEAPPWLIIFDTLGSWTGTDDMNDYSELTNVFLPLKKLRDQTGCGILVIHHNRKQQSGDSVASALGSTAITAHADIIMGLTEGEGNARQITSKGRVSECIPELTVILDEENKTYTRGLDKSVTDAGADGAMLLAMFQPGEELRMSDLIDRRNGNGWGVGRLRKTIRAMLASGNLVTNGLAPNSSKLAYRVGEVGRATLLLD